MYTSPRTVYADNAATTAVEQAVLDKMLPYFSQHYGNASQLYALGQKSAAAIKEARQHVGAVINAAQHEIFFTSGGTESDNIALRGYMHEARSRRGKTGLITTPLEHHAILHTAEALKDDGYELKYVPVDGYGVVDLAALDRLIDENTALVSIMAANNEIGTIAPLYEIGKLCADRGVMLHTDAVQAYGHIPIDVKEMNIGMLSLSAHKLNGPKGAGAIYMRSGLTFPPLTTGGGQERNRRSGTENVPGIVGLGEAARLRKAQMEEETTRVGALTRRLIDGVLANIPEVRLTGHPTNRLPGTASFAIRAVEGESMILMLDNAGICASTGSACSTGSLDPSHVLLGIGLSHELAHGSLRLSLGIETTEEDVDYILEKLPPIVEKLRAMSPVWSRKG